MDQKKKTNLHSKKFEGDSGSFIMIRVVSFFRTTGLVVFLLIGASACAQSVQTTSLDDILRGMELETVYETTFDEPVKLIRDEALIENENFVREVPADVDWVLEGKADVRVKDGRMYVDNTTFHCVLWNTRQFPESFVAEWDFQHHAPQGTAIFFFAAHARDGGSIFTPGLPARSGRFGRYTRGEIKSYHTSYTATDEQGVPRGASHLKKNIASKDGNVLGIKGKASIDGKTDRPYRVRLAKINNRIILEIDGEICYDWTDEGKGGGDPFGSGQLGFRQMHHTDEASYGGLKVQKILNLK